MVAATQGPVDTIRDMDHFMLFAKNLIYLVLILFDVIRLLAGVWICAIVSNGCNAAHYGWICVFGALAFVTIGAWVASPVGWRLRLLTAVVVLHVVVLWFVVPDAIVITTTRA